MTIPKFLTPNFLHPASDHWIPYRLAVPGENIDDFSHNDYTELVFKHEPTNIRLLREFNMIFFNDSGQGLKLMKSMWEGLEENKKEKFYKNFSLMLSDRIGDNSGKNIMHFFFPPYRSKKRAEIYVEKLEVLYNDFFFATNRKQNNNEQHVGKNGNEISLPQPLNWEGGDIELFELIDALYRCGKLPGATQSQIINWVNLIFSENYDADQFGTAMSEARTTRKEASKFLRWLTKTYDSKVKGMTK